MTTAPTDLIELQDQGAGGSGDDGWLYVSPVARSFFLASDQHQERRRARRGGGGWKPQGSCGEVGESRYAAVSDAREICIAQLA